VDGGTEIAFICSPMATRARCRIQGPSEGRRMTG